jgi:hypothetical protein
MDARWPWRRLMGAKGAAPTRRHAAPTACCAGLPPIYGCQRPWPPLAPTVPTHGLPAPTVLGVGWIRMMPTGWGFGHGVPIIGTGNGRRAIGPGAHTWAMGAHSWARGAANPWARWCPLVGAGCPQSEWGKGTDGGSHLNQTPDSQPVLQNLHTHTHAHAHAWTTIMHAYTHHGAPITSPAHGAGEASPRDFR